MPQGIASDMAEKLEDRLTVLADEDPVTAWGIWRVRQMMEHRGVTQDQLADELGVSRTWTSNVVWGRLRKLGPEARARYLERCEDAITRITDRKGGIPDACCGAKAYVSLVHVLAHSSQLEV